MVVIGVFGASGCSAAMVGAILEGASVAAGNEPTGSSRSSASSQTRGEAALIFGGENHKTFLGCFCEERDQSSVFNRYSEYGNRYSLTSLYNRYSDFGSRYGDYSACDKTATDPPVVVLPDGTFLGRLTVNRSRTDIVRDRAVISWLEGVCGG